jgi:pSer/pThr/pTyr-binding forkhead associated (FHA) protein
MVLESYIECLSKAVHVVDFSVKRVFNVGRRVSNDITVSDISVSREQATLELMHETVYLSDSESKFGTFVMVQDLYPINEGFPLPIQIEKKCFFILHS